MTENYKANQTIPPDIRPDWKKTVFKKIKFIIKAKAGDEND